MADWTPAGLRALVLENDVARLRRLTLDDKPDLERLVYDPEIWEYFVARITDESSLNAFIEQAIHDSLAGTRMVFAIVDKGSGRVAGSTAFGNIAPADRRLEIGWSWLGRDFRGTGVNKAAKFLLLEHCFTAMEAERVEFKTDILNERAKRGLESIGAKQDGVMRSFNVMPGGRRRDAVFYSILKPEWPEVRAARFGA